MQFSLTVATLAGCVSAGVLQPRLPSGCCTQLTVSGGVSGSLGQLGDGQNRVGPGYGGATYCLNGGGFTDQSNRGCILTPPTTQFQCDVGARPTTGFAIGSSGQVTSGGSNTFYACPATTNGVYNIYTRPVPGQSKCVQVQLKAANAQCYAAAQPYSNSTSSSARPVVLSTPSRSASASTSPRPASSSTSARPAVPSTASRGSSSSSSPRPATPSSSPRPATPSSSSVAAVNAPVTVTTTVAGNAPATVTQTVTATVCPVQAPIQGGQSTSPRPVSPSTSPRPVTSSTSPRTVTSSTSARPVTSSTSPRPVTPSTSPRPVTSSTSPRPVTPSTSPRPVTPTTSPRPVTYTNTTRPVTPTSSKAQPASTCPALLNGNYQYPHLIVSVNSQQSTRAYGNSYNAVINPSTSTDFNFDIPQSYAGKTCNLVFYFPTQAQLQTSSFTQNTNGGSLRFQQLSRAVSAGTTFQSQPPVSRDLGVRTVAPGSAYTIASGACAAGQTVSYALSSLGGYSLTYFQDYNPCPIGLYITSS